ncbi:MAG: hypothetical protein HETSPECPRED_009521 [Heterodermia speciosa]|uniref:Uncharacterized protein n=1 Tax=Heterodermia speciosa TaxID=116794 RepID=A0A8H3EM95_9LECA|nr:MAG: hypothetical protein HETSPECPRED_009521 [Heterodermia speciosa]
MKRKFSLSSLRLKSAPAPEESRTPEELDSPPYSPTPSCTERPRIPSQILQELKDSCNILVTDTNPPSDDYDQPSDHQAALRKYREQQAAKKRAQARAAEKVSKREQESFFSRRPRNEHAEVESKPAPYKHIPRNAAADFENTAVPRRPSQSYHHEDLDLEPIEPYHTRVSAKNKEQHTNPDDPLLHIRAALESRPKTSAAACIDYSGPSMDTSSNSTSRSNTTYDGHGRPISTGVTSINLTPGDEKRISSNPPSQRVSEQILQDGPSASLADATAKAWMMQELARRRAEAKANGPARPGSRSSYKPTSAPEEDYRPPSRASSIARSVTEGVREYIRPRASMDSMRSSRSDNVNLSRSHSRSSSTNRDSRGGWRAQLRRRGSFSSWRSTKPQQGEEAKTPNPDGGVNLNRDLPALPGLDQYKEKKPKPAHIAQIMRPGARTAKSEKTKPVTMSTFNTSAALPLSPVEEQRRQYEIRRAVEEKMRATGRQIVSQGNPSIKSPQSTSSYSPHIKSPPQQPGASSRSPHLKPQTASYSPQIRSPQQPVVGHYNAGLKSPTTGHPETLRTQSQPVLPTVRKPAAAVAVKELEDRKGTGNGKGATKKKDHEEEVKRPSLRKRLSRFWSGNGVEKKGMGVAGAREMVAAN